MKISTVIPGKLPARKIPPAQQGPRNSAEKIDAPFGFVMPGLPRTCPERMAKDVVLGDGRLEALRDKD